MSTPPPSNGVTSTTGDAPSAPWWRAVTILATGLILALAVLAAVWVLARPLLLLLAAIVIAEAIEPAVERIERRLPRTTAVALVYVALLVLTGLVGLFVAPRLGEQAATVLAQGPALVSELVAIIDQRVPLAAQGVERLLQSWVDAAAPPLAELPVTIISALIAALLVLVMAVYWSVASPALYQFGVSLVPPGQRDELSSVITELTSTLGGYVRARAVAGIIVFPVVSIGLLLIGMDYPVMLGLLAGLGQFVPFIGSMLVTLTAATLAFIISPAQALIVLVFLVVVQQLKRQLLMPILASYQANIPPILLVFAILAGGSVAGLIGVVAAPPFFGALRILVIRVVAPALRRRHKPAETADQQAHQDR